MISLTPASMVFWSWRIFSQMPCSLIFIGWMRLVRRLSSSSRAAILRRFLRRCLASAVVLAGSLHVQMLLKSF